MMLGAIFGSALFLSICNFEISTEVNLFVIIGTFVAFSSLIASFVVPMLVLSKDRERLQLAVENTKAEELTKQQLEPFTEKIQSANIVRFAVLEGAVFANVMFYFLEKRGLNLGLAALLLFVMLIFFPTKSRLINTLEGMLAR